MEESGVERADREAAEWLARLNTRSVTTDELAKFYEWRREPANAAAYARGEKLWHDAKTLGDDPDIAASVRDALSRPRIRKTGFRPDRRLVLAGAVSMSAALAAGWWLVGREDSYETTRGEQRLVPLADGSRLRLNTDTKVSVAMAAHARHVRLERGQAYFEVRHDPARPLFANAGDIKVEALGTAFDLRLAPEQVSVVLAEGRIAVTRANGAERMILDQPGDCATLGPALVLAHTRRELAVATSWTTGKLLFHRTPLAEAIGEANRYSSRQIVLHDSGLAQMPVDGTFQTGDVDSFVAALETLFSLRAQAGPDNSIVLSRA